MSKPDAKWQRMVRRAAWGALVVLCACQAAGQTPATWRCVAGRTSGVPDADAESAVAIVCDALARAGGSAGGHYRVDLRPLGRSLLLTVSREEPADARSLRLASIEELPVAAPRVVEALLHGLSLEQTQRVDNLLESETRYTPLRRGTLEPTLGIVGLSTLGHSAPVGAGFCVGLEYVTPRFSIPGELRWADGESGGDPSADMFAVSTGGRFFFSNRDVSPFVGAGLGWMRVTVHDNMRYDERGFYGDAAGLALYLEGGVELLRLHRARLRASARIDLPTRRVRDFDYCDYDPQTWSCRPRPREQRYVVPLTFGLGVSF